MPTGASQIFVEQTRQAAEVLGISREFILPAAENFTARPFVLLIQTAAGKVEGCTSDGAVVIGVLQNTPNIDEDATILNRGESQVVSGEAFSINDLLTTNNAGKAIQAGAGDYVFGEALEAASGADEFPRVQLGETHLFSGGGAVVKSYALIRMGSSQGSDLLAGDHIQFDSITEQSANNDIAVSTGAGQANGLITLPAKVFELSCEVGVLFGSAASSFRLQFRNNTGAVLLGEFVTIEPFTLAGDVHSSSVCWAFAPGAGAIQIEARIVFVSGTITQIQQSGIRGTLLKVREL